MAKKIKKVPRYIERRGKRDRCTLIGPEKLTPQQARFVDAILECGSMTEAMRRINPGIKHHAQAAMNMMRKDNVRAALERRQKEAAQKSQVTLEQVVAEMAKIAMANLDDFTALDDKGRRVVDWDKLNAMSDEERRDKMAALSSFESDVITANGKKIGVSTKFKLWDKKGALRDLLEYHGGITRKTEHSGPGGGPIPVAGAVLTSTDPATVARAYQEMVLGRKP